MKKFLLAIMLLSLSQVASAKAHKIDLQINNHTDLSSSELKIGKYLAGRCHGFPERMCDASTLEDIGLDQNGHFKGLYFSDSLNFEGRNYEYIANVDIQNKGKYTVDLYSLKVNTLNFLNSKSELYVNLTWGDSTKNFKTVTLVTKNKKIELNKELYFAVLNGGKANLELKAWPINEDDHSAPWLNLKLNGIPDSTWSEQLQNLKLNNIPKNAGDINGSWKGIFIFHASELPMRLKAPLESMNLKADFKCVDNQLTGEIVYIEKQYNEELDRYQITGECGNNQANFDIKLKVPFYLSRKIFEDTFNVKVLNIGSTALTIQLTLISTNESIGLQVFDRQ